MRRITAPHDAPRLALLDVEPDHDPRLLRWKFEHGSTLIVARSLARHPVVTDLQTLGPVGPKSTPPADVEQLIRERIANALPLVRLARRRAS